MALSYTTVPTYSTGSKLAMADWNNVAGILNNSLSTVATKGTYSSTSSSATAPFFIYGAVVDETTNGSGLLSHTFPQAFPNGLIMVQATLTYYNAGGTSQAGHTLHIDYANCDKTKVAIGHFNGTTAQTSISTRFNLLVIGY